MTRVVDVNEPCSKVETDPHETDEALVADGLVGFVVGRRTLGRRAVAVGRVAAAVVVAALDARPQLAVVGAARALQRKKLGQPPSF